VLAVREYENWLNSHAVGLSRDGTFETESGSNETREALRNAGPVQNSCGSPSAAGRRLKPRWASATSLCVVNPPQRPL